VSPEYVTVRVATGMLAVPVPVAGRVVLSAIYSVRAKMPDAFQTTVNVPTVTAFRPPK
jgi:hypothetical protein